MDNIILKSVIIDYLKSKKNIFKEKYSITTLGLYGSYARDEATLNSDIDIFYQRDNSYNLKSGLEFLALNDDMSKDLGVSKLDFVNLNSMNPIIKHYAEKDFIYV